MPETVPSELLQPIVRYFNPRRIILFGSRARDTARVDSDYDLLVVVDDDTPPQRLTLKAGFDSAEPYKGGADVIPCRESTYQRRAEIVGTLCHIARVEGRVVYERV